MGNELVSCLKGYFNDYELLMFMKFNFIGDFLVIHVFEILATW